MCALCKAQKNDNGDAEASAEAATRPAMRFVELKSESNSTNKHYIGFATSL